MLRHAVLRHAVLRHSVLRHAMLCFATPCFLRFSWFSTLLGCSFRRVGVTMPPGVEWWVFGADTLAFFLCCFRPSVLVLASEYLSIRQLELQRRKGKMRRRGRGDLSFFYLSGCDKFSSVDSGIPSSTCRQNKTRKNVSGKKLIFPLLSSSKKQFFLIFNRSLVHSRIASVNYLHA